MKHKFKAPSYWRAVAFCIIFTMIWNTTPISASVQDNLQSAITKILGQKSETTNEANFNNASTNAKLNYLNSKMSNFETKVGVSGVPQIAEVGQVDIGVGNKTFYGKGYLRLRADTRESAYNVTIDGKNLHSLDIFDINSDSTFEIPFTQKIQVSVHSGYAVQYALYLY